MDDLSTPRQPEVEFEHGGRRFRLRHANAKDHIFRIVQQTRDFYEREFLEGCAAYLKPGDLVVDVGANIGNHSIFFAGVCEANVVAFEPNPDACALLEQNIVINGLGERIGLFRFALGEAPGRGRLDETRAQNNLGAAAVALDGAGEVEVRTLDDVRLPAPLRFIKIDAEGMDLAVLRGARRTLSAHRPIVAVEAGDPAAFAAVASLLNELGYVHREAYNYTPTHIFALPREDDLRHAMGEIGRQYVNFATERAAVNERFTDLKGHLSKLAEAAAADRIGARETRAALSRVMEASVMLGAWLEREAERSRQERARLRADLLNELKAELARAMREKSLQDAEMLGALSAELRLSSEAIAPAVQRADPPPLRPFFDAGVRADEGWRALVRRPRPTVTEVQAVSPHEQPLPVPIDEGDAVSFAEPRGVVASPPISVERIADIDFATNWENYAWAQGAAALEPGGVVRGGPAQEFGLVSAQFDCAGGGLVQITLIVPHIDPGVTLFVRGRSAANETLGADMPLSVGENTVRLFAPARTDKIKLYVLALTEQESGFALGRMLVERLDETAHQRHVRAKVGEPVIASIASIPSRRAMLADCVRSLLLQCDTVRVFLNNYPDVPGFLDHPRVEVRRSQDWDDRGDAGKVFWLDKDTEQGYRLITDDDLIFPPDFAEVMCANVATKDRQAIYAMHGILLRQPIAHYYDDHCRAATFHFARHLDEERALHIAATNALCMHSSAVRMRWGEFMYPNSADVWLALHAQRNAIPLLTPPRRRYWVRENRHEAPGETIYDHSRKRTRSRMDSSLVQDAALRFHAPLTLHPTGRRKFAIGIVARTTDALNAATASWLATRSLHVDWMVMLAYPPGDKALAAAVDELKIEHETHIVCLEGVPAQVARMMDLAKGLDAQAALIIADCVRFDSPGWESGLEAGAAPSGAAYSADEAGLLRPEGGRPVALLWSARPTGEVADGAWFRALHSEGTSVALNEARTALASAPQPVRPARRVSVKHARRINDVFERVVVLNLDRRPDRWEAASAELRAHGVEAERFSAVDGADPDVAAEYEAYLARPLTSVSPDLPELRYSQDFYMKFPSQAARIAHVEQASGKRAIASKGAWGYLKSYEQVIERALADQVESLLVFDDDVLLHKDAQTLFARAYEEMPDDWRIMNLGTLQYSWEPPWVNWHSPHTYRSGGAAIGSHAVGMRFEILPFLLDHIKRMDMPYDMGALSAAIHAFSEQCFFVYPNIAIQRLMDSDIGTSDLLKANSVADAARTYRWVLQDYGR